MFWGRRSVSSWGGRANSQPISQGWTRNRALAMLMRDHSQILGGDFPKEKLTHLGEIKTTLIGAGCQGLIDF